jgi:hypothetical protein
MEQTRPQYTPMIPKTRLNYDDEPTELEKSKMAKVPYCGDVR